MEDEILPCLRGGSLGAVVLLVLVSFVALRMLCEVVAGAGLPLGSGGGTQEVELEGSLLTDPMFVKLEKEVEAEVVLVLLFFLEGS